jgi:hypothetical protein
MKGRLCLAAVLLLSTVLLSAPGVAARTAGGASHFSDNKPRPIGFQEIGIVGEQDGF